LPNEQQVAVRVDRLRLRFEERGPLLGSERTHVDGGGRRRNVEEASAVRKEPRQAMRLFLRGGHQCRHWCGNAAIGRDAEQSTREVRRENDGAVAVPG